MIGITGTPGTGKSAVAAELRHRGCDVLDLKMTISSFVTGHDTERDADMVDVDAWAEEFPYTEGYLEGSLAHFLPCDKIIVLRCRPDVLQLRLEPRGYSPEKIRENCEAEALDVILIETVDMFASEQIYEIDTTNKDVISMADEVTAFAEDTVSSAFGALDWSAYLVS